jgi:Leucine-rich repeat (LRR) protein
MQLLSAPPQFALPRIQFRLRTLVIGLSLVAAALAPVRAEIARCQAIQELQNLVTANQGEFFFDYQLIEEGAILHQLESSQPTWIRGILGAHAFAHVIEVRMSNRPICPEILGKITHTCPRLVHLSLRDAEVNRGPLHQLARCKALRYLELSDNPISDAALDFIDELQHLETLCLEDTRVEGQCFESLARLPALKYLTLVNAPVTDRWLKKLAASKSIEMLFLAGSEITDASIPILAEMKSLNSVSLGRTKVTQQGRERLTTLRPDISQS